jgi:myo-inositol-1-phosphate synthase
VGLIGIGNCASALVQGTKYYGEPVNDEDFIGLKHPSLGNYYPRNIEFVSAFDIAAGKVGKDLSEAIFASPNNTLKFTDVPKLGIKVLKGPKLDGIGDYTKDLIKIHPDEEADVAKSLRDSGTDIVINLLPGGAPKASMFYAEESLKAGCAFVNATPIILASKKSWSRRFEKAGLPLVGDDLLDQVGSTFLHKVLLETLNRRGVKISETYQLDVGGGTESADTLERVWGNKRLIKTKSVESVLPYKTAVVAGSTDFVEFLQNRRDSFFWLKGSYFGGVPFKMDIRLNTIDAPNAGSILLDVIRSLKLALEKNEKGHIIPISSYAFKHPMKSFPLLEAEKIFEDYIRKK